VAKLHGFDIRERLQLLDERVDLEFAGDGRFQVVIVGGGALVLRGYLSRSTDDIDVLGTDNRLYGIMEFYDVNGDVNAYMDSFPYNYEDRVEPLWSGRKIDYYTASLEDIVIAKLCSSRGDDMTDIELVAEHINWEVLKSLAHDQNEVKASVLSDRRYSDFLANYETFERRFRPCGG